MVKIPPGTARHLSRIRIALGLRVLPGNLHGHVRYEAEDAMLQDVAALLTKAGMAVVVDPC